MTVTIQSESPFVLSTNEADATTAHPAYPVPESGRPTITISGANARLLDE